MLNQFSRTQLLYGKEAMNKLQNSYVAIFGLDGVGGYVGKAPVRSGIGSFDLIDDDKICLTNINRQIFFYNLLGTDKYESEKEYFTIEIHNTGATTAILNINDSNFTLKYKKYLGTFDGKEKYEDEDSNLIK